jgi:hypothetical protein
MTQAAGKRDTYNDDAARDGRYGELIRLVGVHLLQHVVYEVDTEQHCCACTRQVLQGLARAEEARKTYHKHQQGSQFL